MDSKSVETHRSEGGSTKMGSVNLYGWASIIKHSQDSNLDNYANI